MPKSGARIKTAVRYTVSFLAAHRFPCQPVESGAPKKLDTTARPAAAAAAAALERTASVCLF